MVCFRDERLIKQLFVNFDTKISTLVSSFYMEKVKGRESFIVDL